MLNYRQLIRQHWPLLSFGLLTIFFGNIGQSFFISWFSADIQQQLRLNAADYGASYALATLTSGTLLLIWGKVVDDLPLRRVVVGCAIGLIAACLMMTQISGFISLTIGFLLLRFFGQGMLPHISQTTMARFFNRSRGKALSISSSGVPLGEAVLPAILVGIFAALSFDLRWYLLAALVLLGYLPLAFWLLKRSTLTTESEAIDAGPQAHWRRRDVLKDSRFWRILPLVLAGPFMVTALFIQQQSLIASEGWSQQSLATAFILYGIGHWLMSVVAGSMIDRFTARRLLPIMVLPLGAAMALITLTNGSWTVMPFMLLLGIGIGATAPTASALWPELYGTKFLGAIRSLTTSLMIFSTASAPWIYGMLVDYLGWQPDQIFALFTAWILLAVLSARSGLKEGLSGFMLNKPNDH
ncbi:MFS transporter [Idiomarina tyrosinivorans]|uniref:MFS transporter n=1 Tax=Idiomarina tyrosinivorans TaxID=1445662 RepID=A0A432ZTV2_9GAMM|nr:MFS transporter [Idiomarina tyrosinivorans]RUO81313.1 MFS transporter [Idiomarina tyrosinivorans]